MPQDTSFVSSLLNVIDLTFPLCPLRVATSSKVVVEKIWMTLLLTAAKRWPPLLNVHYKHKK